MNQAPLVRHPNPNQLTRGERFRVIAGLGGIGLLMTAILAVGAEKASQPSPLEHTHPAEVTVTAGVDGNNETDLANFVAKKYNTVESPGQVRQELDDRDPGHDAVVGMGEKLTITVDVPDNQK